MKKKLMMEWLNKAHGININMRWFWMNLGWYPGNPFAILSLSVLEVDKGLYDDIDFVQIFSVQVLYFCFAFGWH